jgi:hypothetical protein
MTSSNHLEADQITPTIGPASAGQRLLWIFERGRAESGVLNVPVIARLRSQLNKKAMERAINTLVVRHESLRTRMQWKPPRLIRVVAPDHRPELRMIDVSSATDPKASFEQQLKSELGASILSTDWPIRVTIWTLSPDDHVVCINLSHVATDSSSNEIILKELAALYNSESIGADHHLPEVRWQYSQWIDWQKSQTEGRNRLRHISYWEQNLKEAVGPQLSSPGEIVASNETTGFESQSLSADLVQQMIQLATQERATLFCVLLAIFYSAICRQTGQTDLTVTTLLSERNRPELLSTVGYFVNAVPLRTAFHLSDSFVELVHACRTTLFGAIQHQTMAFHLLPRTVTQAADIRLENVVVQMMGDIAKFPEPFAPLQRLPDSIIGRTFDLEFVLWSISGAWWINVLFGTNRFDKRVVRSLLNNFRVIAELALAAPMSTIGDLVSRASWQEQTAD